MTDPVPPSHAPSGMSLERKLPLLITTLLLLVVGTVFTVVYHEVMRSARTAAVERLMRITPELAASAQASTRRQAQALMRLGRDSLVQRALAGGEPTPGALDSALRRAASPSDSSVQFRLWTSTGRSVPLVSWVDGGEDMSSRLADVLPERTDSARFGPMYVQHDSVFYWVMAPLRNGRRRIGWIAERLHVSESPTAQQRARGLFGRNIRIYYRNDTGSFWTAFTGSPAAPPTAARLEAGLLTRSRPDSAGTNRVMAVESPIEGTPWTLAVEQPVRTLLAGPRTTLLRLALFSFVVLLIGVTAVWVISRRLVRPVAELAGAAESIAGGDYSRRVDTEATQRSDEIGRLAKTFNYMAEEISASHAELEQQVEEAQSLTEELEQANAHLQESTLAAEEARDAADVARREAEEANRAKSAFLATMSHELRTPLNAIAGYTALLEMEVRGPVTPAQREDLERISRSQRSLLALVDDVLSFARIEAGRTEYEEAELPLDETLAGVEALIAPQTRAKGIAYEYQPAGPEVRVWGDRGKIERVVLNLLSNAVKFTERGGRIKVDSELSGDDVLVRVADTGQGIAPDQLEAIFEPFTQGERGLTRTTEGTGLGLAISREFARGMGGDLTVESTVGAGSTFTLRMPASPSAVRAPAIPFSDPDTDTSRSGSRGS